MTAAFKDTTGLQFRNAEYLGEGVYGQVFSVDYQNKRIALKVMKVGLDEIEANWEFEVNVMKKITDVGPDAAEKFNLVEYMCHGHLELTDSTNLTSLYIGMELLGLSVHEITEVVKAEKKCQAVSYKTDQIRLIGKQVATAMAKLKELNVLHLDLKPENIFFKKVENKVKTYSEDETMPDLCIIEMDCTIVKVGDFGCSEIREDALGGAARVTQTQNYRAPEVFLGMQYDFSADVWSFGCILSEMYTGDLLFFGVDGPHNEETQFQLMMSVLRSYPSRKIYERAIKMGSKKVSISKEGSAYVGSCASDKYLNVKPLKTYPRYGDMASGYLYKTIQRCLAFDPEDRLTFKEVLEESFFNQ